MMRTTLSIQVAALLLTTSAFAQQPPTAQPDAASAVESAAAPPSEAPASAPAAADAAPTAAAEPVTEPVAAPAAEPEQLPVVEQPAPAAEPVTEPPRAGPVLELPPEVEASEVEASEDAAAYTTWRAYSPTGSSGVGGYAELHYVHKNIGEDDGEAEIDLHRLVLFVSHEFDADIAFYSETEIEHGIVADGSPGEVSVEQAFLDYRLLDNALGLRAGIVLVPMGMINTWHEPPTFNGVERPSVDKLIIPTTWSEGGIGLFGESGDLRYRVYVVGGLDASQFRAKDGIRKGRQKVGEASADGLAVTGRVEYAPALGVVGGISGYYGHAGPNATLFAAGADPMVPREVELDVPVTGVSLDLRGRMAGIEARALVAAFIIGDTDELNETVDELGVPRTPGVGEQLNGAYIEAGYDVLHTAATAQELVPFVRFERYDTEVGIGGDSGITEWVFGVSYRPILQVVFKADYIHRTADADDEGAGTLALGVGVMY